MNAVEQATQALDAAKAAAQANPTADNVAAFMAAQDNLRQAETQARRAGLTPHVRKAPKRQPGRMSGPRYFNLMRAIEAHPEQYADYRPTTYCGAPLTEVDWDRREALAAKNAAEVTALGVCPACLTAARNA